MKLFNILLILTIVIGIGQYVNKATAYSLPEQPGSLCWHSGGESPRTAYAGVFPHQPCPKFIGETPEEVETHKSNCTDCHECYIERESMGAY
ncbi:MAG: hypothetical protein L3J53_01740 [Proteobacteria bacterium]|nr:hypothetical protein [Pseudomonadota bacterium]